AISKQQHFKLLILAGILMALAWYTRVTAIGLGLFYLILFIKGWGGKRSRYVYVAAVFLLLIGAECFYFLCLEGNPIHRITTVLHTHMGGGGGGKLPGTGNVVAEALGLHILEPFLVLLFNQEFALLFWFAIPAMLLGLRYKSWQTHEKRIFFYISFLCLVWFVFVSYLMPGRLLPRYYNVAVVTACIAMGIFISNIFDRRRVLSMSILATIISFNMFSVYVENKDPLFGECSLLELSLKYDETIYTDPYTASRASFLLETEGKSVGISTPISVPDGSLYFYNPNRVLEGHQPKGFSEKYSPLKTWKKLETISQERKLIGIILEKLNLNSYVPTSIYKKLNCPNGPVHLFRTFPQ
ncbi:MAG: hypothetical protein U9R21_08005, partial [Candidatus Thermoplasmatota archaeon]|nr:hypothetical protein [Candidatus Thermoplasmatota archaeon]